VDDYRKYTRILGDPFSGETLEGPSLKRGVESAVSDSELVRVTNQLFKELRGLSIEELRDFRRSLDLVLRLTGEIEDLEDEELEAVIEFLKARREKSKVEPGDKKTKVKILEPPYVVDPEPEE
jgi:hypothetical protein